MATTSYIYDIQTTKPIDVPLKNPGVSEAIRKIKKVRRKISKIGKRPEVATPTALVCHNLVQGQGEGAELSYASGAVLPGAGKTL
jgi:hypothetical protein